MTKGALVVVGRYQTYLTYKDVINELRGAPQNTTHLAQAVGISVQNIQHVIRTLVDNKVVKFHGFEMNNKRKRAVYKLVRDDS